MAEIETVTEHPLKRSLADIPRDASLTEAGGWSGMEVQWIVTAETVGAAEHVVGLTVFAPGAKHHPHRHPQAEEAQYLIKGSGLARVGDMEIVQNAGDTVFVPRNEWHGFENTSQGETVMLWTYGGAPSLEQAGYERQDVTPPG
jgi:quercetin dioxygenase-like cupin family protein